MRHKSEWWAKIEIVDISVLEALFEYVSSGRGESCAFCTDLKMVPVFYVRILYLQFVFEELVFAYEESIVESVDLKLLGPPFHQQSVTNRQSFSHENVSWAGIKEVL